MINYPRKEYKMRGFSYLQPDNYKQKGKRKISIFHQNSQRNQEKIKGFREELKETHTRTSKHIIMKEREAK